MDPYKELQQRLSGLHRTPSTLMVGRMVRIEGEEAVVRMGSTEVTARLRATSLPNESQLLITPAVDSAVVLGSLSGDLTELVVLAVDKADRIEFTGEVVLNGGEKGGIINVADLTAKLNQLVDDFNKHTHIGNMGTATTIPTPLLAKFMRGDYEDERIKH